MIRLTHRKWGFVFKGIVAVIGLILFIAQSSYKFYQSANLPPIRSYHAAKANPSPVENPTVTSKYDSHSKVFLSLDKRYDLAHVYFLPASFFNLPTPRAENSGNSYRWTAGLASRINLLASLRAPPGLL
jgi:hypothetical protein